MKRRSFLSLLAASPLTACTNTHQVALTGSTMGTTYSIKLTPPKNTSVAALRADIQRVLLIINQSMSTYDQQSELSLFNQNRSTDWISASTALLTVLDQALRISALSKGAFDVTVGPLVNLWGFGPTFTTAALPNTSMVDQTRNKIGYQQLAIDFHRSAIRKQNPELYVDLSSIAKGYGVDQLAKLLDAYGIGDYLIDIGGELRAKGLNSNRAAWQIAITEPTPTPGQRSVQKIIQLSDHSVATSGNYRAFFEHNGQRYSHIINPTSGWPIKHQLTSVTVVEKTAMRADGLATALLVLGSDKGLQLAQEHNIAALFISTTGSAIGFHEQSSAAFQHFISS